MKVFYTTAVEGVWLIGSAVIAVADDKKKARKLILEETKKKHMNANGEKLMLKDIHELDTTTPSAVVLVDGDY